MGHTERDRERQRQRDRKAETQAEREAGSMQGVQLGTRSQVSRINHTLGQRRHQTTEPPGLPQSIFSCTFINRLFDHVVWSLLWTEESLITQMLPCGWELCSSFTTIYTALALPIAQTYPYVHQIVSPSTVQIAVNFEFRSCPMTTKC